MKKKIILLTSMSIIAFAKEGCIVDYNKFETMSNSDIIKLQRNCKEITLNKVNIIKTKTKDIVIIIKPKINKTKQTKKKTLFNVNKKPVILSDNSNKHKSIKEKIKKPINLKAMNLINLIKYALKHNLTDKKTGEIIISKAKNYSDLDLNSINYIFSHKYTKKDLKTLLNAIEN